MPCLVEHVVIIPLVYIMRRILHICKCLIKHVFIINSQQSETVPIFHAYYINVQLNML